MNIFCSVFLLLHITVSGTKDISGGEYNVAVRAIYNASVLCGGVILNRRYVLTAAHCLDFEGGHTEQHYYVVTGTNRYNSPGETYYVEEIVRHCNFNISKSHNDIALVRLNSSIKWNPKTLPIRLRYEDLQVGESFLLTDWSVSNPGDDQMRHVTLNYMPFPVCRQHWDSRDQSHELFIGNICARRPNSMNCDADAGSPLVDSQKRLVGITNLSRKRCEGVSIFASVMYHIDWINMVLSENEKCGICRTVVFQKT